MILAAFVLALFAAIPQDLPEKRMATLSRELGSADPSTRDRATDEFVAMGRPALKTLQALEKSATDPEVRSRASAAARTIYEDLRWDALKLDVSTDRRKYEPGDTVTVTIRVKNVEDFPVTIYLGDGVLQTNARASLASGGKPVPIVVSTSQVFVTGPITVDETRFRTIPPGESVEVHALSFKERWDLGKKDPGLKASYTEESRRPLEAGAYQVKASVAYGFKNRKEKREALLRAKGNEAEKPADKRDLLEFRIVDVTLSPKAEKLMSESWQGSLEGIVDFEVAPK